MAWERRAGSLYYYSGTRRAGRFKKVYHGKGLAGEMAAEVISRSKRRRAEQAKVLAAEKARLAPLVQAMTSLDDACRLITEASLTTHGFHRHNYAWRRRRVRQLEDRGVVPATG